jgi:hypothetical protein
VTIIPIGNDRLPELDRDLPNVQFTSDERILATGSEWLPVKNKRSLCIDIVANSSMDWHHDPRLGRYYRGFGIARRLLPTSDKLVPILEMASVLSHLAVRKGRVRVSIVDPLRIKTIFNREDAASFDWQQASQFAKTKPPLTVDIDQLAARTQASAYLRDKLEEILEDNECPSGTETSLKAVIVVGTDMVFAENTPIRHIFAQDQDAVRFFYFKIPKGIPADDDLPKMLKETKPKAFTVRDGFSFRKDLADLISRLEKFAK